MATAEEKLTDPPPDLHTRILASSVGSWIPSTQENNNAVPSNATTQQALNSIPSTTSSEEWLNAPVTIENRSQVSEIMSGFSPWEQWAQRTNNDPQDIPRPILQHHSFSRDIHPLDIQDVTDENEENEETFIIFQDEYARALQLSEPLSIQIPGIQSEEQIDPTQQDSQEELNTQFENAMRSIQELESQIDEMRQVYRRLISSVPTNHENVMQRLQHEMEELENLEPNVYSNESQLEISHHEEYEDEGEQYDDLEQDYRHAESSLFRNPQVSHFFRQLSLVEEGESSESDVFSFSHRIHPPDVYEEDEEFSSSRQPSEYNPEKVPPFCSLDCNGDLELAIDVPDVYTNDSWDDIYVQEAGEQVQQISLGKIKIRKKNGVSHWKDEYGDYIGR